MDSSNSNNGSTNQKVQSFLESLRARSLVNPTGGENNISNFESFGEKLRQEKLRKEEFFRTRTREFNQVYSLKERREKQRISELQQELLKVSKSVKQLDRELDTAVNETPVTVGEYQFSFFEHLQIKLKEFRLKVDRASTWLHHFNNRRQKQDYFWAMAQSKGTKFTLSEERQVAMSVG